VVVADSDGYVRGLVGVLVRRAEYLAGEATACLCALTHSFPLRPWRRRPSFVRAGDAAELAHSSGDLAHLLHVERAFFVLFVFDIDAVHLPFDHVGEPLAHDLRGVP
jgi:hypothetical protein